MLLIEKGARKGDGAHRLQRGGNMKPIAALCIVCLMVLATGVSAADCKEWNSEKYFETAAVEDVTGCLQSGADPNVRDKDGNTPLHQAAGFNENPAVIAALVDVGADPKARNKWGLTPLHRAGFNQKSAIVAALVDAGAEPNIRDGGGNTPLHVAAMFNENPAVITALLDAGADPKARDKKGKTPWDYAKPRKRLKGSDAYRRLRRS